LFTEVFEWKRSTRSRKLGRSKYLPINEPITVGMSNSTRYLLKLAHYLLRTQCLVSL
jgi:hypothetical protein